MKSEAFRYQVAVQSQNGPETNFLLINEKSLTFSFVRNISNQQVDGEKRMMVSFMYMKEV